MMNWRRVSAVLVLGSLAACATATDDNPPAGAVAGAENGGDEPIAGAATSGAPAGGSSSAGASAAGAPAAGAPSAGAPSAGSGSGGKGGSGSGGKGGSGAGGTASGGSSGAAGMATGGKAGTGSGGGAGTAGTAGGTSSGPCASPKDVTGGGSGNLGTTDAVCLRTTETFNTVVCSNFTGRTLKVNGVAATCSAKTTFPPAIGGYNYFEISAGSLSYASINWFSS